MTLGTPEETKSRISEAKVEGQMADNSKTGNKSLVKGKGRHWEATKRFAAEWWWPNY